MDIDIIEFNKMFSDFCYQEIKNDNKISFASLFLKKDAKEVEIDHKIIALDLNSKGILLYGFWRQNFEYFQNMCNFFSKKNILVWGILNDGHIDTDIVFCIKNSDIKYAFKREQDEVFVQNGLPEKLQKYFLETHYHKIQTSNLLKLSIGFDIYDYVETLNNCKFYEFIIKNNMYNCNNTNFMNFKNKLIIQGLREFNTFEIDALDEDLPF